MTTNNSSLVPSDSVPRQTCIDRVFVLNAFHSPPGNEQQQQPPIFSITFPFPVYLQISTSSTPLESSSTLLSPLDQLPRSAGTGVAARKYLVNSPETRPPHAPSRVNLNSKLADRAASKRTHAELDGDTIKNFDEEEEPQKKEEEEKKENFEFSSPPKKIRSAPASPRDPSPDPPEDPFQQLVSTSLSRESLPSDPLSENVFTDSEKTTLALMSSTSPHHSPRLLLPQPRHLSDLLQGPSVVSSSIVTSPLLLLSSKSADPLPDSTNEDHQPEPRDSDEKVNEEDDDENEREEEEEEKDEDSDDENDEMKSEDEDGEDEDGEEAEDEDENQKEEEQQEHSVSANTTTSSPTVTPLADFRVGLDSSPTLREFWSQPLESPLTKKHLRRWLTEFFLLSDSTQQIECALQMRARISVPDLLPALPHFLINPPVSLSSGRPLPSGQVWSSILFFLRTSNDNPQENSKFFLVSPQHLIQYFFTPLLEELKVARASPEFAPELEGVIFKLISQFFSNTTLINSDLLLELMCLCAQQDPWTPTLAKFFRKLVSSATSISLESWHLSLRSRLWICCHIPPPLTVQMMEQEKDEFPSSFLYWVIRCGCDFFGADPQHSDITLTSLNIYHTMFMSPAQNPEDDPNPAFSLSVRDYVRNVLHAMSQHSFPVKFFSFWSNLRNLFPVQDHQSVGFPIFPEAMVFPRSFKVVGPTRYLQVVMKDECHNDRSGQLPLFTHLLTHADLEIFQRLKDLLFFKIPRTRVFLPHLINRQLPQLGLSEKQKSDSALPLSRDLIAARWSHIFQALAKNSDHAIVRQGLILLLPHWLHWQGLVRLTEVTEKKLTCVQIENSQLDPSDDTLNHWANLLLLWNLNPFWLSCFHQATTHLSEPCLIDNTYTPYSLPQPVLSLIERLTVQCHASLWSCYHQVFAAPPHLLSSDRKLEILVVDLQSQFHLNILSNVQNPSRDLIFDLVCRLFASMDRRLCLWFSLPSQNGASCSVLDELKLLVDPSSWAVPNAFSRLFESCCLEPESQKDHDTSSVPLARVSLSQFSEIMLWLAGLPEMSFLFDPTNLCPSEINRVKFLLLSLGRVDLWNWLFPIDSAGPLWKSPLSPDLPLHVLSPQVLMSWRIDPNTASSRPASISMYSNQPQWLKLVQHPNSIDCVIHQLEEFYRLFPATPLTRFSFDSDPFWLICFDAAFLDCPYPLLLLQPHLFCSDLSAHFIDHQLTENLLPLSTPRSDRIPSVSYCSVSYCSSIITLGLFMYHLLHQKGYSATTLKVHFEAMAYDFCFNAPLHSSSS